MANEPTDSEKPITTGDGENFGQTTMAPEDGEAGVTDPGKHGEDTDILGKKQEDLTAEDLEGDARSSDAD